MIKYKILPFPYGKEFAVTFADDTDLSTCENIKPVYDFLHKKGLYGTKTVWVNKQQRTSSYRKDQEQSIAQPSTAGETVENEQYREFVKNLQDKGFEIALHGVAAGNSYREEIVQGLERYRNIFGSYPNINIFHERNIDNLYAGSDKLDFWPLKWLERYLHHSDYQGHIEGSPYFWGDVAKKNIKYMRLPFHTISEVNTWKVNPSMPYYDRKRPFVNLWFSNSDGSNCSRFIKLLAPSNIQKLHKQHGICLVYTHFAKEFTKKNDEGEYILNNSFMDVVNNLCAYREAWFPTTSELLDRMELCQQLEIIHQGKQLTIRNHSDQDVNSLSLKTNKKITIKNQTNGALRCSQRNIYLVEHIPAQGSCVFNTDTNRIFRYHLKPRIKQSISRLEKVRIELYNYYGLFLQDILKK